MAKSWLDSLGLWNTEFDPAHEKAQGSNAAARQAAIKYGGLDLSRKKIMQQEGLLNADGSINYDRYLDKNYLKDTEQKLRENNAMTDANARAMAGRNSLVRGGSPADILNTAKLSNDANRSAAREMQGQVKGERTSATNLANQYGATAQSDARAAAIAEKNAADEVAANDAYYANSQERGLFQDPTKLMNFAGDIGGAITGLGGLKNIGSWGSMLLSNLWDPNKVIQQGDTTKGKVIKGNGENTSQTMAQEDADVANLQAQNDYGAAMGFGTTEDYNNRLQAEVDADAAKQARANKKSKNFRAKQSALLQKNYQSSRGHRGDESTRTVQEDRGFEGAGRYR